jgi:hypothetical protein
MVITNPDFFNGLDKIRLDKVRLDKIRKVRSIEVRLGLG